MGNFYIIYSEIFKTFSTIGKVNKCKETYSDVLASPVTLLSPVDRGGPVDLKKSDKNIRFLNPFK